jgi:hypothetical protein
VAKVNNMRLGMHIAHTRGPRQGEHLARVRADATNQSSDSELQESDLDKKAIGFPSHTSLAASR